MLLEFTEPLVVKNPPANAEDIRDQGLIPGLGRFLRVGKATHSSILARGPWTEEPGGYSPWGCTESDMTEVPHTHSHSRWDPLSQPSRRQMGRQAVQLLPFVCSHHGHARRRLVEACIYGKLFCSSAQGENFVRSDFGKEPISFTLFSAFCNS